MDKKYLLVAASALVVGLSFGTPAFAGEGSGDGGSNGHQRAEATAVAASFQAGEVEDNDADHTLGAAAAANIGGTGLFNVNVNAGANSQLQGQNTLGAILNCSCTSNGKAETTALALSTQVGEVEDNSASGARATTENEGGKKSWSYDDGFKKSWHDNSTSTPVASAAALSGVTGTGMFNINVNAGANSLLQGQNTVAAIIGSGGSSGGSH